MRVVSEFDLHKLFGMALCAYAYDCLRIYVCACRYIRQMRVTSVTAFIQMRVLNCIVLS